MRLEGRVEVREERRDVRSEALFQSSGESTNHQECILDERRSLASRVNELKDESHDAVRKRLDAIVEFPDDGLWASQSQPHISHTRL